MNPLIIMHVLIDDADTLLGHDPKDGCDHI